MNYEAIRAAMQEEIDEPLDSYQPSDPGSVIRDRLFRQCYWEEAAWFWGAYCRGWFDEPQLDELMPKLEELIALEKTKK